MLTAYDATSAYLGEQAGVPMLLVGDVWNGCTGASIDNSGDA